MGAKHRIGDHRLFSGSWQLNVQCFDHSSRSRAEDQYPVAEIDRFFDVMRDEQDREVELPPNAEEPILELSSRERIQRTKGLVEQQGVPIGEHGAQQRSPLTHTSRQRAGIDIGERLEVKQRQQTLRLRIRLGTRDAAHILGEDEVVHHAAPGQEKIALGHVTDSADAVVANFTIDADLSFVGFEETDDHVEDRAFPAPGGTQYRGEFPDIDLEGDVMQGFDRGILPTEGFAYPSQFNFGWCHRSP